jgi:hypothetical protein
LYCGFESNFCPLFIYPSTEKGDGFHEEGVFISKTNELPWSVVSRFEITDPSRETVGVLKSPARAVVGPELSRTVIVQLYVVPSRNIDVCSFSPVQLTMDFDVGVPTIMSKLRPDCPSAPIRLPPDSRTGCTVSKYFGLSSDRIEEGAEKLKFIRDPASKPEISSERGP